MADSIRARTIRLAAESKGDLRTALLRVLAKPALDAFERATIHYLELNKGQALLKAIPLPDTLDRLSKLGLVRVTRPTHGVAMVYLVS